MIVTDKMLVELHLLDGLIEAMEKVDLNYVIYDGVAPNPTDLNIEDGVLLYLKNHCDCMIAFGGGSPMDCAKGSARGLPDRKSRFISFRDYCGF